MCEHIIFNYIEIYKYINTNKYLKNNYFNILK